MIKDEQFLRNTIKSVIESAISCKKDLITNGFVKENIWKNKTILLK